MGPLAGLALFFVKLIYPKKMNIALIALNRYLIISIAVFSFLTLIVSILLKLVKKNSKSETILEYIKVIFASTMVFVSFTHISQQIYLFTTEFVYFGEDGISTITVLRALGFSVAILICILTLHTTYKVGKNINSDKYYPFYLLSLTIYTITYALKSVTSLQRLRIIKLNDLIFQLMIISDNYYKQMIYALLLSGVLMLVYVIHHNTKLEGNFENNAQRRKQKARLRSARRYSYTLLSTIVISICILSFIYEFDTKEIELTPPQPYKTADDMIIIPLSDIDDGHLHRFSYITPNGNDVRFIAVKKPIGTSYGLGLDACEICGTAGYFERKDDVVCKRCDVVMNKATIGFKGGCNPIPFPYVIENSNIYINMKDLIREENRFR